MAVLAKIPEKLSASSSLPWSSPAFYLVLFFLRCINMLRRTRTSNVSSRPEPRTTNDNLSSLQPRRQAATLTPVHQTTPKSSGTSSERSSENSCPLLSARPGFRSPKSYATRPRGALPSKALVYAAAIEEPTLTYAAITRRPPPVARQYPAPS